MVRTGANASAVGSTPTANQPVVGMRRLEDSSSIPRGADRDAGIFMARHVIMHPVDAGRGDRLENAVGSVAATNRPFPGSMIRMLPCLPP